MSRSEPLWVFGYGSLMWRPGFPYRQVRQALVKGYHRSFCVFSHRWRGTPAQPGLVLGLTPGGDCRGLAFEVAPECRTEVIDYLDAREMTTRVYVPSFLPALVGDQVIEAYSFVADQTHCQYAGDLPAMDAARIIMEAQGEGGLNRDYLINTVRELECHGFVEPALHDLLRLVEQLTGLIDRGEGI